jgi:glucose/arabinose dehydrogenase
MGNVFQPERREFKESLLRELRTPPGFEVSVIGKDLGNPRMVAVAPDGTVYITRPQTNDVVALKNGRNGQPAKPRVAISGLQQVHGIAISGGRVYLASPTTVWVATIKPDGLLASPTAIISDLPDGGQHRARTIGIGPEQMLYVSIGSSCNDCAEGDKDRATIQRFNLDGSGRTTFARGLRNTIGFAWHPDTGALWGMDNGSDWKGDDQPPEELNLIREGRDYGWPLCFGKRLVDPLVIAEPRMLNPEKDITREEHCAATEGSALDYVAHSAPIGMIFYTGRQFPPNYRGDALVAFHGSWNKQDPVGHKVVRIRFRDGQPQGFEDFLTGFLIDSGQARFGRPAGIAMAPDGSVVVSDDLNGMIYRVSYDNE